MINAILYIIILILLIWLIINRVNQTKKEKFDLNKKQMVNKKEKVSCLEETKGKPIF